MWTRERVSSLEGRVLLSEQRSVREVGSVEEEGIEESLISNCLGYANQASCMLVAAA